MFLILCFCEVHTCFISDFLFLFYLYVVLFHSFKVVILLFHSNCPITFFHTFHCWVGGLFSHGLLFRLFNRNVKSLSLDILNLSHLFSISSMFLSLFCTSDSFLGVNTYFATLMQNMKLGPEEFSFLFF